jgi:hypothetical protein
MTWSCVWGSWGGDYSTAGGVRVRRLGRSRRCFFGSAECSKVVVFSKWGAAPDLAPMLGTVMLIFRRRVFGAMAVARRGSLERQSTV